MDKSCRSSGDSIVTTSSSSSTTTSRDQYLDHLNKLSHKISKPPIIKKHPFDPTTINQNQSFYHNQVHAQNQNQQQQQQPPVYNINKSDFRDVVQKLTGSPAHERFSSPQSVNQPKPQSSRLQRIRPPPLAHLSNRPPHLLNSAVPPPRQVNPNNPISTSTATATATNSGHIGRPVAPLSPLPPFPTVHAAAESPVSAYMRYLQSSSSTVDANSEQFSGFSPLAPLVSPRWNIIAPQQQGIIPPPQSSATTPPQSQPQLPTPFSPLPFGCLNSPRSSYPLFSPIPLFSPSSGQLGFPQLPLSPTVPVLSPTWRGF